MTKVVVVDDDQQLCRVICRTLERRGYEVVGFQDAKKAIKYLRDEGADIVMTDIIMPDMDGFELVMEIKKSLPEVKIFAMSGGGAIPAQDYLSMITTLGASGVLYKPFETNELLEIIAQS